MGYELSPDRKRRRAKARQRQQAKWAAKAGPVTAQRITREQAFSVNCPTCLAEPGEQCIGKRADERVAPHAGRYVQYQQSQR